MFQQAGEELLAFYRAVTHWSSRRRLIFKTQGLVALGLVWPEVVMESHVILSDVLKVTEAEA